MIQIDQTSVKPDLSGRLEQNNRTQAWEQLVTRQTQILGTVKVIIQIFDCNILVIFPIDLIYVMLKFFIIVVIFNKKL